MTPTATLTATERRSAARRQPTIGTVCRFVSGPADGGVGLVWNISTGGVSMLFNEPIDRGVTFRGVLANSASGFTLPVIVRITHVARLQNGDYHIGGPFETPIAAHEMKRFLPHG
jgi:hypothetical protein